MVLPALDISGLPVYKEFRWDSIKENGMARKGTAIVTGASQGIGAGVVQAFLERGYKVVANSRNITSSGTFRESDKLALVDGNIGEIAVAAKIVETAITRFGSIDALVNNAGIFFGKPFTEFTAEDFEELSTVNLKAVARQHLGSLDKVTRIVRLGVAVATSGDVRDQPKVADAASELLQDVFGKDKNPCRLVYGVASLPLGTPVELEVIFEVSA